MKRHPACPAGGVQQRIQNGPVSYGIRSVFHAFCFAIGRSDRSGVEVISADGDRRFQIAALHEFIDGFTHLSAFAVTEPANACRQALELDAIARQTQPAIQRLVVRKKFEREIIGLPNVLGFTRECDPAKRAFAFTEKRANVFGHEAGNLERILTARIEGHLADVVAVIEGNRAVSFQREHRLDVARHRFHRALHVSIRFDAAKLNRSFQR